MMLTEINTVAQAAKKDCWIIVLPDLVLISGLKLKANEEDETELWMIDPYVVTDAQHATISPYLSEYTNKTSFVINKDLIITLVKPNAKLQAKYDSM